MEPACMEGSLPSLRFLAKYKEAALVGFISFFADFKNRIFVPFIDVDHWL